MTKTLSPTAENWTGDIRALTTEQLNDRVHAIALMIANDASAGRPLRTDLVAKYTVAADERDRRVFGEP